MRGVRENALSVLMAACGSATVAWLGLYGFAWNDYDNEARAAVESLVHGHLGGFLQLAPAYGGSFLERAPFAFLPSLWGGGELAVYRMLALPCLLAGAVLGVWLVARMRREGRSKLARAVALAVCVANPVTLYALELGHPEELLGASLCVAAVLLAARPSTGHGRPLLVGVMLGLAVANKQWAVLAAGPVLLVLPARQRLTCLLGAGATAGAVMGPLLLSSSGFVADARALASPSSVIFQPWQLLWFFGHHGALVHGAFGAAKPGFRTPPGWSGAVSHPLVLGVALAITVALWLRRRQLTERDALLALALLLLMRCMLDTWDVVYYPLPFIFALLAWEVLGPANRPPVLALASSVLVWFNLHWMTTHVSPDAEAAFFLAWSLPLAAWLGVRVFAPGRPALSRRRGSEPAPAAQETTVSALGRLVSSS
jgi:glycosyl transferase family 87